MSTDPEIKQLRREVRYRFRRAHPIAATWPALGIAVGLLVAAGLVSGPAGIVSAILAGFSGTWALFDVVINARLRAWGGSQ